MRARHRHNGSYVTADEAVLRRLPAEWEIEAESEDKKPAAPRKTAPARIKKSGTTPADK